MSKKWITLCLAGCFGVVLGIAGMGASSAYASEGKKMAMEGAVFDLKASTSSSLTVYGFVSDKALHPVEGATVKMLPGGSNSNSSGTDGSYSFSLDSKKTATYSIQANKSSLGSTKKVKFKVKRGEVKNFIVNLQFKKAER